MRDRYLPFDTPFSILPSAFCFWTRAKKPAGLNVCGGCGLASWILRTTTILAAWTAVAPEGVWGCH